MKKLISILIGSALLLVVHTDVSGQSISITDISPSSPSNLNFNEQITVTFEYEIRDKNGVRIFIRPITSGKLTPNYAADGSSIYRGRGRETANLTVRSGEVTVDQLRIQVLSSNQNEQIFEFYIPVEFTFSPSTFNLVQPKTVFKTQTLKVLPQKPQTVTPVDTVTNRGEVVRRTVTEDGTIELHYSDGTIMGIITSDERYFVDPTTGDTTYTKLMFNQVQGADQPASPPGFAAAGAASVDEEWLDNLNTWIEYLGSKLLTRIDLYLEKEAFKNYKAFEQSNSFTIYEKVNLRYTFLEKLLMSNIQ